MNKKTLKKSIFTIIFGIIISINSLPLIVFAEATQTSGATDVANPTEDQLFNRFNYANSADGTNVTNKTKIGVVNALPNGNWQTAVSDIVKILLNISGALTLLALTVGGVFMITANGASDMLDKGKKIVLYAVAGLVIIAVSYAVVIGVSEFQIFTGTGNKGSTSTESSKPAETGATKPSGTADK